jgi:hypothetical protein
MSFLSVFYLLFFSLSTFAQIDSVINFHGQNGETVKIDQQVNVVRPAPFQVPDTCYNRIPYQSYECHNETRYRQQCQWIPESESCRMENDRVCRNVTRTRQECSQGPDRQVCHDVPGRQVCVERPTRRVCHTNPRGQESCTTVGGGRECHTTGGGRQCDRVPGERVCRQVTYTDQDCENVPRRRCERIPGRNDCQNIPYAEQVCGYETRYRKEPYACQRTEYRDVVTPKKLSGEVEVRFLTNGLIEEFPLQVSLAAIDAKFESFSLAVKLLAEPKVLVVLKKKDIHSEETENEIKLDGEIILEILEPKMVAPVFPDSLKNPVFNSKDKTLIINLVGGISAMGSLELHILNRPMIGKQKTVVQLKASYPSERATIKGDSLEFKLEGLMQHSLSKKNVINLKLSAPIVVEGELLNAEKPQLQKDFVLELKK